MDKTSNEVKLASAGELRRIGEAVRAACVAAALEGYEQAAMDGLCSEGAWEAAVEAIRSVDVAKVIRQLEK